MVTKHDKNRCNYKYSLILAKIHMVTKQKAIQTQLHQRLILAKIHMVTKPQIHIIIYLINYEL